MENDKKPTTVLSLLSGEDAETYRNFAVETVLRWKLEADPMAIVLNDASAVPIAFTMKEVWKQTGDVVPLFLRIDPKAFLGGTIGQSRQQLAEEIELVIDGKSSNYRLRTDSDIPVEEQIKTVIRHFNLVESGLHQLPKDAPVLIYDEQSEIVLPSGKICDSQPIQIFRNNACLYDIHDISSGTGIALSLGYSLKCSVVVLRGAGLKNIWVSSCQPRGKERSYRSHINGTKYPKAIIKQQIAVAGDTPEERKRSRAFIRDLIAIGSDTDVRQQILRLAKETP